MSKRTVIALCAVIAILAGIIAVGVWSLYSGVSLPVPVVENRTDEAEDLSDAEILPDAKPEETVEAAATVEEADAEIETVKVPAGPFAVKNSGTGKTNRICQNKDKSIELKDETGKTLWKKSLGSELCGMVGEVDFFNNGKIQFLMVEGRNVHLLDRLGREVKGFPRTLQSNGILGPEKVSVNGTNYWKVLTESGTVYLNLKKNLILTELPK